MTECDERHLSDHIVRRYGFVSTDVPAEAAAPLMGFPNHGPDRDEPYMGAFHTLHEHAYGQAQADGMGQLWSGDRGDLMMGGWRLDYVKLLQSRDWSTLRTELHSQRQLTGVSPSRAVLSHLCWPLLSRLWRKTRREGLAWPMRQWRQSSEAAFDYPEWIAPGYAQQWDLAEARAHHDARPNVTVYSQRQRYQQVFMPLFMRGMVWTERTQARFGLGFANPWSDRRLASFVMAAPQQVLNRAGVVDKELVRTAMRHIMPDAVRRNRELIVPTPLYRRAVREWARETIQSLITDSQVGARGYIDPDCLHTFYEALCAGEKNDFRIWNTLTLEMWLRQYWS